MKKVGLTAIVAILTLVFGACDLLLWDKSDPTCDMTETQSAINLTGKEFLYEFTVNKAYYRPVPYREDLYSVAQFPYGHQVEEPVIGGIDCIFTFKLKQDQGRVDCMLAYGNISAANSSGLCDTSASLAYWYEGIVLFNMTDTTSVALPCEARENRWIATEVVLNNDYKLTLRNTLIITDSLVATMEKDTSMPARFADWYATH